MDFQSKLEQVQKELLEGNPLTIATTILLIYIIWRVTKRIINPPRGKAPPVLKGIPFFGNAIQFGTDPNTLLKDGYKNHGDCFSMTMFGEVMTVLAGPEGHDLFFKAKEEEFSACKAYQFTVPIFGKDVVYDAPPEKLIEQRKFAGGALTIKRFKLYVPMMEKECEEYFATHWGDSGEVDLMKSFNEITVLTSTRCLQGTEIRETASAEFAKLYWDLDAALSAIGFFYPNLPLPSMLDRNRARKRIGEIFASVIKRRRENPGEIHEDFIATLMESKYKDGTQLPDEHIIGLMVGLLLAGQHTSNVTGTWVGVHLLSHLNVLERVVEEQKQLVGDGPLEYQHIKESSLLDNVMKETLRLRPPIIIMMRRVLKDVEFKGYTIRKGTLVAVSPSLSHRLESMYTNPDSFDPDRFSPEREEDKKNPFSFISFGAGKHACIGESFAYVQVKSIWSWLLRNYEIELINKNIQPNFKTMVVGPVPPVTVRYKKIK